MAKLLSRERFPPKGFCVLVPAAGMKEPFSGSFSECVAFLIRFRQSNPALVAKNGWSLDPDDVAADVDAENTARMIAHGWLSFVDLEGDPEPRSDPKYRGLGGLAAVADGAKLIIEWLGSGQRPVSIDIAEKRAAVCAGCPCNTKGDWTTLIKKPFTDGVRHLLGVKHDMDLRTSHDAELGVCSACECILTLKCWSPLKIIVANTPPDVWGKFDARCWLLAESKRSA